MRKKLAVLVAGLTAAGAAVVGPAVASPAVAATQGSCAAASTTTSFYGQCTAVPDNLQYFAWADCTGNHWGFGLTEPGNSDNPSTANCPSRTTLVQGGLNIGKGVCPVTTDDNFIQVSCTALPDSLKYFAWVQCAYGGVWAFGPTELGTSGVPSYTDCFSTPDGLIQTAGFNIG
jgi:hypothetical protein